MMNVCVCFQEPGSVRSIIPAQSRNLLKETLKILQVEGEIFRKVLSQDEVYNVGKAIFSPHTHTHRKCLITTAACTYL